MVLGSTGVPFDLDEYSVYDTDDTTFGHGQGVFGFKVPNVDGNHKSVARLFEVYR